jgi:hypothetical protein
MSSVQSVSSLSLPHPHLRGTVSSTRSINRVVNRKSHPVAKLIAPKLSNVDQRLLVWNHVIISEAGKMSEVQKWLVKPRVLNLHLIDLVNEVCLVILLGLHERAFLFHGHTASHVV